MSEQSLKQVQVENRPLPQEAQQRQEALRVQSEMNEAKQVSLHALRSHGSEIYQRHKEDNKPPTTQAEKALHFFGMLQDKEAVLEVPADGSAETTPAPIPLTGGKEVKIRIKQDGDSYTILSEQASIDGEDYIIRTINGRQGDMLICAADKIIPGGHKTGIFLIPADEVAMAQMTAEIESLQDAPQLSPKEKDLVKMQNDLRLRGDIGAPDYDIKKITVEAAKTGSMMTRDTLTKYAEKTGMDPAKLEGLIGADGVIISAEQAIKVFEAGGMFDKNVAQALAEDALIDADAARQRAIASEEVRTEIASRLSAADGDEIVVNGAKVTVTPELRAQWEGQVKALETSISAARREEASRKADAEKLKHQAEVAQGAEVKALMADYLKALDNGEIPADKARGFLSAIESGNQEALFEALLEKQLLAEKDKAERERKRAEAKAKYEQLSKKALTVGAIGLLVILMLFKDSAKQ